MPEGFLKENPSVLSIARVISWAAAIIAVLQGICFVLGGHRAAYKIAAVALAVTGLLLAIINQKSRKAVPLAAAFLLYIAEVAIFIATFSESGLPVPFRLLQVAIVLTGFGPLMAALIVGIRLASPVRAVQVSSVLLLAIFAMELILPAPATPQRGAASSKLIREMAADTHLGGVNPPNTTVSVFYRGNPQTAFQEQDPLWSQAWLRLGGSSSARLETRPNDPDIGRVSITQVGSDKLSYIQLDLMHYQLRANCKYSVSFRARSDRPRQLFGGVADGQTWQGVGFPYNTFSTTPDWRSFTIDSVTPVAKDVDALILFDMGQNDASVELSSVKMRNLTDGTTVEPKPPVNSYVQSYKFNALGCRGRDYSIPKPSGTRRLLVLGNSYALGAGVSDEATFSVQLERMLNERATSSQAHYEVINCGAAGYSTREERLFYESTAVKYEPDVVLVTMSWSDYMGFGQPGGQGSAQRQPAKLEGLFHTWGALHRYLRRSAVPDFSQCIDELAQLETACTSKGARLVVFIFRNNADTAGSTDSGKIWNQLSKTATDGLYGKNIPLLDLGKVLAAEHADGDLKMHSVIGFDPNSVAHGVAARELASFVLRERLIQQ
jgi:hypothetical protein